MTDDNAKEQTDNEDMLSDTSSSYSDSITKDSYEERIAKAGSLKDTGNGHFKAQKFAKASKSYSHALSGLRPLLIGTDKTIFSDAPEEQQAAVKTLFVSLSLNEALMKTKLNDFDSCAKTCDEVLRVDDLNVKAFYRKGVARKSQGLYDQAKNIFNRMLEIDATNTLAKVELQNIAKDEREHRKKEASMFGGFLAQPGASLYGDKEREAKQRQAKLDAVNAKRKEDDLEPWTMAEYLKDLDDKKEKEKKKKEKEQKKHKKLAKARSESKTELEIEEEDQKLIEEVAAKGYCHHKHERKEEFITVPKKLEEQDVIQRDSVSREIPDGTDAGGSAWNAAGTWEDKDMTDWVKKNLKKTVLSTKFSSLTFRSNAQQCDCKVDFTDFKVESGEASRSVVRNKARFIFDMNVSIETTITTRNAEGTEKEHKGKIVIGECSDGGVEHLSFSEFKTADAKMLCREMEPNVTAQLGDALSDFMTLFQQQ